jgi:xanthine dehydrogenase YagT iron-sulfur-binding subunit
MLFLRNLMGDKMDKKNGRDLENSPKGLTRRGFLTSMGVGAVALGTVRGVAAEPASVVISPEDMAKIDLLIDGRRHRLLVEPRWSLLYVLREKLGLTGTKMGCDRGECGACTVLLNNVPHYSCMTLAVEAEGNAITTVAGLMKGEELGIVQQAFVEEDAFQCGYCTSGQIMTVEGLLRANPKPSLEEIRRALSGNLCRCGTYTNIIKAARRAAGIKGDKGDRS